MGFSVGGGGDKHQHQHAMHLNFHFHHHRNKPETPPTPKGSVAILVGQEQKRFVIPVMYVNHPLFVELLKAAEDEYGFDQKGPISIPCPVEEFRALQGIIHHHIHHHHHHLLHLPISCFRTASH